MKQCKICSQNKEVSEFLKWKLICKPCSNAIRRERRKLKPLVIISVSEKLCSKCGITKSADSFHKEGKRADGLCNHCKECRKQETSKFYKNNKEKIIKKTRSYYEANKDVESFKERRRKRSKERRKTDKIYTVKRRLRNRMWYALKNKGWKKENHLNDYIGCSYEELIKHLESGFKVGMSWENYGEWHIDHKIPLDSAKTIDELYKLSHFSNLQPLWGIDNYKKGNKTEKFVYYEVKTITHAEAKPFLKTYHYLQNLPPIQYYFGLFEKSKLVGVCTYGKPFSPGIRNMLGAEYEDSILEMSRLALKNNKKNEASYLISHSMKMLPKNSVVISFADPEQGHRGTIYKASNFKYYGLTKKRKNYKIEGTNKHPMTLGDDIKNNSEIKFTFEDRVQKHRYIKAIGNKGFIKKVEEMLSRIFI